VEFVNGRNLGSLLPVFDDLGLTLFENLLHHVQSIMVNVEIM